MSWMEGVRERQGKRRNAQELPKHLIAADPAMEIGQVITDVDLLVGEIIRLNKSVVEACNRGLDLAHKLEEAISDINRLTEENNRLANAGETADGP